MVLSKMASKKMLCGLLITGIMISGVSMTIMGGMQEDDFVSLEMNMTSGEYEVFTHTYSEWTLEIVVANLDYDIYDVNLTTTLPAEIECLDFSADRGAVEIIKQGKGKMGAKSVFWEMDELAANETATLTLTIYTTTNPAGKQEFTSPGDYVIVEGARMTGFCQELNGWLFYGPSSPIMVRAVDYEEEPDDEDDEDDDDDPIVETPRMDLLFLIDSTGSMSDEINVVKAKIEEIMFEVRNGTPQPEVRISIVTYRDRSDSYITRLHDFTYDIDEIKDFLYEIFANGGGDGPESVNEALHVALHDCDWNVDQDMKMMFLIGDAPPHMDYTDDYDYHDEISVAKEMGVKIHTIGCSGITGYTDGVSIFQEIADETGGMYQELIYDRYEPCDYYVPSYPGNCTFFTDIDYTAFDLECDGRAADSIFCYSAGAPAHSHSGSLNNYLDVQLTYCIQQEAIMNGVIYENEVELPP